MSDWKPKFVYILKLENNKWYVGAADNLDKRLRKHEQGKGSEWTKLHKLVSVKEIIPNGNERYITLRCMNKYGINNVRGGAWCQRFLTSRQILLLKKLTKEVF